MRMQDWLIKASLQFKDVGIVTGRLDALILLEDEVGKERSWILAHPEQILSTTAIRNLDIRATQRTNHVPLAYIRGKTEFYGRTFSVNPHTLVPRPETETMIELLKSLTLPPNPKILDVGTGSGCIAITAAMEYPTAQLAGCDIDQDCLEVARKNARQIGTNVSFFASDLLEQAQDEYDTILANLPYVPDDFHINAAAGHEPRQAILVGVTALWPIEDFSRRS